MAMQRHMMRWTTGEMIRLEREYELLGMTVQDIAVAHQRTPAAILHKLQSEGLINSWNEAPGFDLAHFKKSCVSFDDQESECDDDADSDYEDEGSVDDSEFDCDSEEDSDIDGDSVCDSDGDSDYQFEEEDDDDDEDEDEDEDEDYKFSSSDMLPWTLETGLKEIGVMVSRLLGNLAAKKFQHKVTSKNSYRNATAGL